MQTDIIWDEFLKIVKEEAGSQVVETWFKAVTIAHTNLAEQTVTLKMPNTFVSKWIQDHYQSLLTTHLKRLLNITHVNLAFITHEHEPAQTNTPDTPKTGLQKKFTPEFRPATTTTMPVPAQTKPPVITQRHTYNGSPLNQQYQFDTFVVGPSNSLAHGAAYAVSQSLGTVYNPLFIYGGTGLGKTHLLHAIGNEAVKRDSSIKVRYETSDQFMHAFIRSIRFDKAHQFRDRYQKIDLLLIDDIQFFGNKEQTQEMFFHIFNALHEQKKQIVLTSDTYPEEMKGVQKRLISRMEWGLVADMQTPDLETKIAILNKKAEQHAISLPDDVSDFIAMRVNSNIRQLEGALIRVDAFASLTGKKITLDLAQQVLLHMTEKQPHVLELNTVARIITRHFGITVQELKSKNRSKNIAAVRQIACYLMKKMTHHSLQAIGSFFSGRDHSTILHAISKVESKVKADHTLKQKIMVLEQEILSRSS